MLSCNEGLKPLQQSPLVFLQFEFCNAVHWSFGQIYWQILEMLTLPLYNVKSYVYSHPIPAAVNVRALKYCKAAKLLAADTNVPKSQVSLKDLNFIIDHKHCHLFPLKCHAQVSHF